MNVAEAAAAYLRAGLCAIPARTTEKRPVLSSWKLYQARLPTEAEVLSVLVSMLSPPLPAWPAGTAEPPCGRC